MSLRSTDQYLIHSKEDKIREVIKKQALSAVGFVSRLQSPLSFLGLLLVSVTTWAKALALPQLHTG